MTTTCRIASSASYCADRTVERLGRASGSQQRGWCDAVCARARARGDFHDHVWSCPTRTPALYPDAVTLDATATAARRARARGHHNAGMFGQGQLRRARPSRRWLPRAVRRDMDRMHDDERRRSGAGRVVTRRRSCGARPVDVCSPIATSATHCSIATTSSSSPATNRVRRRHRRRRRPQPQRLSRRYQQRLRVGPASSTACGRRALRSPATTSPVCRSSATKPARRWRPLAVTASSPWAVCGCGSTTECEYATRCGTPSACRWRLRPAKMRE